MTYLLILAVIVLIIQVVMFFVIRSRKKEMQQVSEIERKYNIHTRSDAWNALNDPDIPESERMEIENLYNRL